MIDYKLHEEIKLLTQNCYNPKTNFLPNDWELINFIPNTSSGFKAGIYKKDDYIVIIYSGTDFPSEGGNISERNELLKDLKTDEELYSGKMPNQSDEAYYLYTIIKAKYPDSRIILGGHSLGGTLAQIVAFRSGAEAVTFNAYAAGKILENQGIKNYSNCYNIYNYGNPTDPIFTHKINKHVGRILLTNLTNDNKPEIVFPLPNDSNEVSEQNIWAHNTESLNMLHASKDLTNYVNSNPIDNPMLSGILQGAIAKVTYEPFQHLEDNFDNYKNKYNEIIYKLKEITAKRRAINKKLQDTLYMLKQMKNR